MKMETVIRSPQKGVVKKLAHKEGVSIPLARTQGVPADLRHRISARLGQSWCCLRRLKGQQQLSDMESSLGGLLDQAVLAAYLMVFPLRADSGSLDRTVP
jgi:hypothetical protein